MSTAVVDSALTFVQVVMANNDGTAFLLETTPTDAERAINEFKTLAAFTVVCSNEKRRLTFARERVLIVEQITVDEAASRLAASVAAQSRKTITVAPATPLIRST